jgi:predicted TIM-barrel fold metal-dependent hydrolase
MVSLLGMLNDAHCHFFSNTVFSTLAQQRQRGDTVAALCRELDWEEPGETGALADRWVRELDAQQVTRAALIASVPGDEASVAEAVAKHPTRFVGYFMVNAAAPDAVARTHAAVYAQGLRCLCLFPAMHHTPLDDERVQKVVEAAAGGEAAVFVHCGQLSVGVRRALGLASRFDLRLGDPLAVTRLAMAFPTVPFIIPHFGAGLLRETLMAADACPNIYLDTSSSNRWIRFTPGLTLDEVFRAALAVVGPGRILFGTDSSYFPRGWQRSVHDEQRASLDRLGVAAADQDLIFGGTFERVFGARRKR